jgi:hypothetical protein
MAQQIERWASTPTTHMSRTATSCANSEFGSVLGSAVSLSRHMLSVYLCRQGKPKTKLPMAYYAGNSNFTPVYADASGRLYTIPGPALQRNGQSPCAQLSLPGARRTGATKLSVQLLCRTRICGNHSNSESALGRGAKLVRLRTPGHKKYLS